MSMDGESETLLFRDDLEPSSSAVLPILPEKISNGVAKPLKLTELEEPTSPSVRPRDPHPQRKPSTKSTPAATVPTITLPGVSAPKSKKSRSSFVSRHAESHASPRRSKRRGGTRRRADDSKESMGVRLKQLEDRIEKATTDYWNHLGIVQIGIEQKAFELRKYVPNVQFERGGELFLALFDELQEIRVLAASLHRGFNVRLCELEMTVAAYCAHFCTYRAPSSDLMEEVAAYKKVCVKRGNELLKFFKKTATVRKDVSVKKDATVKKGATAKQDATARKDATAKKDAKESKSPPEEQDVAAEQDAAAKKDATAEQDVKESKSPPEDNEEQKFEEKRYLKGDWDTSKAFDSICGRKHVHIFALVVREKLSVATQAEKAIVTKGLKKEKVRLESMWSSMDNVMSEGAAAAQLV